MVAILICTAYRAPDTLHGAVKDRLYLIVQAHRTDGARYESAFLRDLRGRVNLRF